VDDEPDVVDILQKSLQKWDFAADGFTNPVTALDYFRQNHQNYSLVIVDLKMKQMTGFQLLEKIRELKPEVKVLLITAFVRELLDIPADLKPILNRDAILEKPFGVQKVCERVRQQLNINPPLSGREKVRLKKKGNGKEIKEGKKEK